MRILIPVFTAMFVVACGDSGGPEATITADGSTVDFDYCTCVNEPLNTDDKLKACGNMMDSMTPEEVTTKAFECRAARPVPEGGPDLCFCLRTMSTDPAIGEACQALIPEDMTPRELAAKMVECGQ